MKKAKATIRDLSRARPTPEERAAMLESLADGHPLVAAVLGITVVEMSLEDILWSKMPHWNRELWTLLSNENGPLSTIYQKIVLGYALGLYDEKFAENLHIVRRIRNAFAHSKKLITFDDPLIVAELRRVQLPDAKRSPLYKRLKWVKNHKDNPQHAYLNLCLFLAGPMTRKIVDEFRRHFRRMARLAAKKGTPMEIPDRFLKVTALETRMGALPTKPRHRRKQPT
jgi:hypothetical protein